MICVSLTGSPGLASSARTDRSSSAVAKAKSPYGSRVQLRQIELLRSHPFTHTHTHTHIHTYKHTHTHKHTQTHTHTNTQTNPGHTRNNNLQTHTHTHTHTQTHIETHSFRLGKIDSHGQSLTGLSPPPIASSSGSMSPQCAVSSSSRVRSSEGSA